MMALTLRIDRGEDGRYSIVGLTDTEIERLAQICATAAENPALASLSGDLRAIVGSARWADYQRETRAAGHAERAKGIAH